MSRKLSSPTAQLLRGSRLFSMPPPIASGSNTASGTGFKSTSDSATQPFPTRQAIATPSSSLHRGDWGLKRPLPLRETTRSSAPTMRVFEVDTINLFTDFESAGDHVRTLEKWQEMGIPITLSPSSRTTIEGKQRSETSAFHEKFDHTYLTDEAREKGHSKWKYKGPYLAGMVEGQFKTYAETRPRQAKEAFTKYLREYLKRKAFAQARSEANGTGAPEEDIAVWETFELSEADFEKMVKTLRDNTTLSSELSRLVREFFDLPGIQVDEQPSEKSVFLTDVLQRFATSKGPPSTHPSAGLSYLRSSALMNNHPILGPQDSREPVEARLLTARQTAQKVNSQPRAGVGGVVAELKVMYSGSKSTDDLQSLRYDEHGGPKIWVSPERAFIDSSGHIKLAVAPAIAEDVQIKRGSLKSKEELEAKQAPMIEELNTSTGPLDAGDGGVREQNKQIVEILEGMHSRSR